MTTFTVPFDYFTKRAKDLQSRVRSGDADAAARVRRVFADASAKADHELTADFGLMRAQHVVAVEHGFANWKALVASSGVEARLAITMARHPELNDFGIGLFGGHRNKSAKERSAIIAKDRETLRGSVAAVTDTVTWLCENVVPMRSINRGRTSYGIKHVADKDIGYITNGVFIAAGIIAGYPYKIDPGSPNVSFGMSEKSLHDLSVRRTSPERVLKRFMPQAFEVLAKRGVQAFSSATRSGVELAWLDDGDLRTLRIGAAETTPFIVRLYIDVDPIFVSRKVAKALGVSGTTSYVKIHPGRPKREITVLLDEVERALKWTLSMNVKGEVVSPTTFEVAELDGEANIWSRRAWERYPKRKEQATAA